MRVLFCLLASGFLLAGQSLSIGGDVPQPFEIPLSELAKRPTVELLAGKDTYTGALLIDLLAEAGQERGAKMRGTQIAKIVLVECEDAYRVAFSMAELDPEFRDTKVLLAWKKNGEALTSQEGPLRLIVEGDKKMARWGRRVKSIRVVWLQ
ncbi:MAG: molybdopterin-binding oxidoreductase [Bryobacter sp.]